MSPFDRPSAPPAHPSTTSPRRNRPASLPCADKVVARWFSADECRLAQLEDKQWKISLLEAGKEPTVVERLSQLPAPNLLRGKWKTRAKVQVDKV